MKGKQLAIGTFGVVVALLTAACGGGSTGSSQPTSLTVWLMNGSAPKSVVDGVNADFKAAHPNTTVKVEIQQWSNVTTKLDTAYAGSNPPDVVELGNTLVAKYASAGALKDVGSKQSSFENSSTWLKSLTESCTFNGKLYCVPYYAGSRAVIYRKDMFDAAGLKPPTSMAGLLQVGQSLMNTHRSDANFSALYFPGKYWYAALPFIWDFGGDVAVNSGGTWKGDLSSSSSQQGLQQLNTLVSTLSRADKTGDELKQDQAFAQGHIAMIIANGWEVGVITGANGGDPSLTGKLGVFPIPSHVDGQTAPVFLGGSDLAVSAKSKNQDLAEDWVRRLANTKFQSQMVTVGGVIPNSTSLIALQTDPLASVFASAAKTSRFTPNAASWANVESANVIPDMLVSIFTKQASISSATQSADTKIGQILNTGS
ncbi:MAG: extracellular solute-binding protein [Chloroflexi bacterium]|nr:MAG: extracellular solute-binding protein [Chloroflexota bacterium]